MTVDRGKQPRIFWLLIVLYAFQGILATSGGLMLVIDQTGGRMQMPVELLAGSPFSSYLTPA